LHFAFVGPADRPTTGKYVCANMSRGQKQTWTNEWLNVSLITQWPAINQRRREKVLAKWSIGGHLMAFNIQKRFLTSRAAI